ncbi:MAG: penicillin-binding protein [Actinobacteria bacterium]|nr:MAG: penicillin-binding protein [Actinomycetota bacterium]
MRSLRLARVLNIVAGLLAGLCLIFLGIGAYLYYLSATLPDLGVDQSSFKPAQTSVVYAADGSVLAEWHGEQDRTVVAFEKIPDSMRDAVVAIEDERFYTHTGVDTEAIVRALKVNAESGEYKQGGSTITQQLVKLLFTDGERTLTRKVREALMAYQLETKADKQELLETYLNLVYFGEGSYGVESAAHRYFGKPSTDLTLDESALLAGIIQSPSRYSPSNDLEASTERRNVVLGKMLELGYITPAEEQAARSVEVTLAPPTEVPEVAPYFVEYVKQDLIDRVGSEMVFQGGLRVQTSLVPAAQRAAEEAARAILPADGDPAVSLVCLDHSTGEVIAMVGGRDFKTDKFNLAVQGRRQPGSAFKPFVLVTALARGVRPADVFSAAPYTVKVTDGVWNVQNYENSVTSGSMTLSAATNWSVNAVYARLIMKVGAENVVKTATAMGITTPLEPNPAIALGGLTTGVSPLEMASAYGTIAAGGVHREPSGIVRVTNGQGETVYQPDRAEIRAIDAGVAKTASLMLHDVVETGTGQAARIGTWAAGKTGTTQAYRDAWFVGYSGSLCTAVWVGHPEGQVSMTNVHGIKVTGGSFPAKIWQRFMQKALVSRGAASATTTSAGAPAGDGQPATQVRVTICTDSLLLANFRCPNTIEIYLAPELAARPICTEH